MLFPPVFVTVPESVRLLLPIIWKFTFGSVSVLATVWFPPRTWRVALPAVIVPVPKAELFVKPSVPPETEVPPV